MSDDVKVKFFDNSSSDEERRIDRLIVPPYARKGTIEKGGERV